MYSLRRYFYFVLLLGNVLFLLWGIRVCYRVRKAESYFNEAKFISFAIYNIAGVNAVFLLLQYVYRLVNCFWR